jgi:O-antigen/teichoic acid export membrane protein
MRRPDREEVSQRHEILEKRRMIETPNQEQGVSCFGALLTSVAAWDLNTWIAVVGFVMGLITFIIGYYYQRRREVREERLPTQHSAVP